MKSRVKINGHLTPLFPITRGVRQGCPISMMLYVMVAEPLNNLIKNQSNIKGIVINNNFKYLLFQHADNTSRYSVCRESFHTQYILSWYGRKSKY